MRRSRTFHLSITAVIACLTVGTVAPAPVAPAASTSVPVVVSRVDGMSTGFLSGVDVSSVLSLEESGVVFRERSGSPADLFAVLADAGVTAVRVRVWNDPFDDRGRGYGGGNVDVGRAVEVGRRATAAGLGVLVDFHYSDFWADPGRQLAPKSWAGSTPEATAAAVRGFTVSALRRFEDAGVDVRVVQVGNETNTGMAGYSRDATSMDASLAALFAAGASAVREVLPHALVALHFTNPESVGRYSAIAAGLHRFGVDYDVFASSYYPYWHGSTANLTEVLAQVSRTYGKKVMVAETSWPYTLTDGDGHPNVIATAPSSSRYPISVQGQATALRDVVAAVRDVGSTGIGVFYWEPAWLPVGPPSALAANRSLWERFGAGWATSRAAGYDPVHVGGSHGGSAWDNQALFAADGRPLESLRTFEYLRGTRGSREVSTSE
ncbi:arabinogalactan endo-1,4-beta-galactosidase [Rathayibacter sp. AY1G1]|jgi:arabinogalactan endo-1,4-beta-galactosidase|uniref:glycosyl hydrolase 53 family protein n=1 Tax=unclassified Rathayibacter TaxID=2609250 RepID=UPI000CE82FA1|nr:MULTISPECIES: glycosyl hydrolase 53 family protein [unclassified Rathayibacter]PPF48741.1 arabinogalactan endo-1,4-beta-galactosidase [Rathayibacter sp. AY1A1]PPG17092.1 arabinogalactan endo-1,4-beta-galactosidase [Rathayibacter sp. AY1E8]PPG62019.1 arabinogalactan endo-1,4-beta-galactosidase [Rathayibacter sp. AY1C7]PPG85629.1 arabinogalactan endo-1,4-beta-galactosidase [Rathayibacter sp. AY1H2]PPH01082.1 arabinogalactan endo-1,4-beta-galactosidase [Rathayibacter sp. AY1G9]